MNGASIMVLALVVLGVVIALVQNKHSGGSCDGNCAHCRSVCEKKVDK